LRCRYPSGVGLRCISCRLLFQLLHIFPLQPPLNSMSFFPLYFVYFASLALPLFTGTAKSAVVCSKLPPASHLLLCRTFPERDVYRPCDKFQFSSHEKECFSFQGLSIRIITFKD